MKRAEEIIIRAILLVCLSDRAALEKGTIEGITYSLEQREGQRKAIYQWIIHKGYSDFLTSEEKRLVEQEVGKGNTSEILSKQIQYEAVEPLLWSLGFIDTLSSYKDFVIEDFHPILEIGGNHSLENLLLKSELRDREDVYLQNEIAILWHWRTKESNNPVFSTHPVKEVIVSTFGDAYLKIVKKMNLVKGEHKDFLVDGRAFEELNAEDQARIQLVAYWRQYALEWVISDEAWEDIELTT